ncbi:MAG: sulfotransferase domain-containing protein [Clostridia bacterium]|nr:sulfotransferase domain-containing protein [Clostridia bacterium]
MGDLPNLICPGAQKAGTTTLYQVLRQHRDIACGDAKEPQFFDKFFENGVDWYRKLYKNAKDARYLMDFTPGYMSEEIFVERMRQTLGEDIRILFMLRNPVDRMYSAYNMFKKAGIESENDARKAFYRDFGDYLNKAGRTRYFRDGLYGEQISYFMERFPVENMKFIIFEEFTKDIMTSAREIFDFLGLDDDGAIDYGVWANKTRAVKATKKAVLTRKAANLVPRKLLAVVPLKTRKFMRHVIYRTFLRTRAYDDSVKDHALCAEMMDKYMPGIKDLEQIIGRDLSIWYGKYQES